MVVDAAEGKVEHFVELGHAVRLPGQRASVGFERWPVHTVAVQGILPYEAEEIIDVLSGIGIEISGRDGLYLDSWGLNVGGARPVEGDADDDAVHITARKTIQVKYSELRVNWALPRVPGKVASKVIASTRLKTAYLGAMLPKLPIGQQYFRGIREEGALYVDKTEQIHQLVTAGKYYFLARPRRFGKSLTLSTIEELYEGARRLFEGLWIENQWNWEVTNPVVHLQFNEIDYYHQSLVVALRKALLSQAKKHGAEIEGDTIPELFKDLLETLTRQTGRRVVLLIDEYDKPLIDYLTKEDLPTAFEHQTILKSFYSVIKSSDAYIQLLLITGVSKFSKVGVFSDLNNLWDISLSPLCTTLVGITQEELEQTFGKAIDAREAQLGEVGLRDKIREWYNGYSFHDGSVTVYNPWSLLRFFSEWEIRNFWFSTGTPTFLVNLMRERFYYEFKQQQVSAASFDAYQLDELETTALLFQTGYLTIKAYDSNVQLYTLDYPNREVKDSMLSYLISAFSHSPRSTSTPAVVRLYRSFEANDVEEVVAMINDLFQSIPHQLFINSKENLYHALIHLLFTYLGQYTTSEVSVLRGRVDAVVRTSTHVYILEFKLDGSAEEALAQIREREYAAAHRVASREVVTIGINFSSKEKRVSEWLVDTAG